MKRFYIKDFFLKHLALCLILISGSIVANADAASSAPWANGATGEGVPDKELSGEVWLAIVATETSAAAIAAKRKQLLNLYPSAKIIHSNDCSDLKPGLFLLVSHISGTSRIPEGILTEIRADVEDAYSRPCSVVTPSLLSLGIPVVHASIDRVPVDAVNWSDEDRVSRLLKIDDAEYLLIERAYDSHDESPLEGMKQSIYYFRGYPKQRILIERNCWDMSQPDSLGNRFSLHCANEMAANQWLHTSIVFDTEAQSIVWRESYCRNPRLTSENQLSCEKESIDAQGRLSLSHREILMEQ